MAKKRKFTRTKTRKSPSRSKSRRPARKASRRKSSGRSSNKTVFTIRLEQPGVARSPYAVTSKRKVF